MAQGLTRVPVREQNPKVRATNFEEVCYGYNKEEAVEEHSRSSASLPLFRPFVDVYARRRASVRVNVYVESKVNR